MEWEEEINPFHLETLTCLTLYCEKQNSEPKSTDENLDAAMEKIAVRVKNKSES
ncbi:hypothetical protein BCV72DRAFT_101908 [Rhizopus microsporus var. microsporus]|uniref:Uncharacterized protein n=2 Tax=Rhizopus microsporus TaxID=58291 RepID=A0A2G4SZE4_RHIZD|nr:uncharacterized protein RHIMIDRAFT_278298 [Rhizopus microsporus ATCC 52813]ORE00747.1 hypothetical protein BCV72DRAFT_101908 [Rhizopus microsporus var. microsporus]PHZ14145.1 hypothetical protein RHIMIDRAFT_278298 [Rhizopus microsporus ATCC 52813]